MNKSFGITIRPKCGIEPNSELESKILKAIERYDYYHCVAEKTGVERHLHFQLWTDEEKRKGDIKKTFTRILQREDWWDQGHKKFCILDRYCYNDWYDGYCENNEEKSEDESETLLDNVPAITDDYYPSDVDQEKWKAEKKAVDKTFHNLMVLWYDEWDDEKPEEIWDVAKFFNAMMYKQKKIKVIEDKKRRAQRVESLFYYLKEGAPIKHSLMGEILENYTNQKEALDSVDC